MGSKIEITPEQLEYIREHIILDGTCAVIAATGISRPRFYRICAEYGIHVRFDRRTQCNPPEQCFDCPHPDCIRGGIDLKQERDFRNKAFKKDGRTSSDNTGIPGTDTTS